MKFVTAISALCLVVPATAQAFNQCTVTPLGGPGAEIVEEASNPVTADGWVYAGFTQDQKTMVMGMKASSGTLGAPVMVNDGKGSTNKIRLAAAENRVYAVWQQRSGGLKIMFAASRDHGKAGTWDTPIELAAVLNDIPQISADASNVHIVYVTPSDTIEVVSSSDSGRTFSAPVSLGQGAGEVIVSSSGKHVYVAWETGTLTPTRDVMWAVSKDGGKTFTVKDISDNGVRNAREPIMSLNPTTGRISMVWREDDPVQGVYIQSVDNGKSWTEPLVVGLPARQVMVRDEANYVWITYLEEVEIDGQSDWQTNIIYSTDGGKTFSEPQNLSGPSGISKLNNDDARPIPWTSGDNIRVTGIEADGVHIWSGQGGHLRNDVYLGPGILASPNGNFAAWQGPNGMAEFASCK
jgi:hypothetical protein